MPPLQSTRGTVEIEQGVAQLVGPDAQGQFDYDGETKIYWNSQQSVTDREGRVTLCCDQHHVWQAARAE